MERLDRLGWAAGRAINAYGVRVGVRTTDPAILHAMEETLPPGWTAARGRSVSHMFSLVAGGPGEGKGVRKMWILYDGWVREARSREAGPVLEALNSAVRLKVAEHAPRRVFVHAGCVAWKGRAIVIPGRSYSGKTTLVAELVKAGATYYSDEYAVLDAQGRVHPFPSQLSIRAPGSYDGELHDAAALGGRTGRRPLPIGMVLVTRYREGGRWRPRALSPAEGALALLADTVPARSRPHAAMEAVTAAVRGAEILKGSRGEAVETVPAVLQRLLA